MSIPLPLSLSTYLLHISLSCLYVHVSQGKNFTYKPPYLYTCLPIQSTSLCNLPVSVSLSTYYLSIYLVYLSVQVRARTLPFNLPTYSLSTHSVYFTMQLPCQCLPIYLLPNNLSCLFLQVRARTLLNASLPIPCLPIPSVSVGNVRAVSYLFPCVSPSPVFSSPTATQGSTGEASKRE